MRSMASNSNSIPSTPTSFDSRPIPRNIETAMSQNGNNGSVSPLSSSPRTTAFSGNLQAAATLNAGLQRGDEPVRRSSSSSLSRHRQSPSHGRRRSQVLMNLQAADPSIPAPGEMVSEPYHLGGSSVGGGYRAASPRPIPMSGSPRLLASSVSAQHSRTPSLGELHQELENEQEFQVNRLLQEIRRLQAQVAAQQQGQSSAIGEEAVSASTSAPQSAPQSAPPSAPPSAYPSVHHASSGSLPRSPGSYTRHPRSSFDMARADIQQRASRTPSRGVSPALRSASITREDGGEQWLLGGRDESAFYQAETGMLIRENQMLRHRIRDLERQLTELTGTPSSTHHGSHLNRATSMSEQESSTAVTTASSSQPILEAATPKEE